jgi:hypothetical protein
LGLEIILDSHPSEEVFEEYAFQRLSDSATDSVEEHLLICAKCQEELFEIDQYIQLMKHATARTQTQAPRIAERFGSMAASMAVSVAGATAVLGMMLVVRQVAPSLTVNLVQLVALRGGDGAVIAEARSGGPLELEIDLSDLPAAEKYRVELVNSVGEEAWSGGVAAAGGKLSVRPLRVLQSGIYWVRLYSNSGELLREFGLRTD